jgi:RluA family pseudouridine synthase
MVNILYEDGDILAVDKPEGIASIPERDQGRDSLAAMLSRVSDRKLYVVHRLDKEVSGVLLFAKAEAAHRHLNLQFERREVHKTYLALVHGVIEQNEGTIDKPVRQFGSGRMGVDPRGQQSVTRFTVVRRSRDCTLVSAEPVTGRRHQLRVHFYSIGHPIVGDPKYGDKSVQSAFPRLMLHAYRVRFRLPSGGEVSIESPLPESFARVLSMK